MLQYNIPILIRLLCPIIANCGSISLVVIICNVKKSKNDKSDDEHLTLPLRYLYSDEYFFLNSIITHCLTACCNNVNDDDGQLLMHSLSTHFLGTFSTNLFLDPQQKQLVNVREYRSRH